MPASSVLYQHRAGMSAGRRNRAALPAGHSGRDVVAEIAHLEQVAADAQVAVAELQDRATVVAAEHGHELGDWAETEHLYTAAHCQHCTASVCLRMPGFGSNADPLKWLQRVCGRVEVPRYRIVPTSSAPKVWMVRDGERPALGALAMHRKKAAAQADADARNGGPAIVSPADKALAAVERLRGQLARAEQKLQEITGASVSRPSTREVQIMPKTKPKVTKPEPDASAIATPSAPKVAAATKPRAGASPLPSGPTMAAHVLDAEQRPMSMALIAERVLEIDGARPLEERAFKGKTPAASLSAKVSVSARDGGTFVKVAAGVFGLRAWDAATLALEPARAAKRERVTA